MRTRIAGALALVALIWLAAAFALDRYGQRTPDGTFDAIVVAGCRVDPGGVPSLALQRRTRRAVELWSAGAAPRIVFTGGVGTYPPSEAEAASLYAESLGVPPSAILREERSHTTEENARFAGEVLDPGARIIVVTDAYHVLRAERVFGRVFAEAEGAGSVPRLDVRVWGALREVAALSFYGAEGRL